MHDLEPKSLGEENSNVASDFISRRELQIEQSTSSRRGLYQQIGAVGASAESPATIVASVDISLHGRRIAKKLGMFFVRPKIIETTATEQTNPTVLGDEFEPEESITPVISMHCARESAKRKGTHPVMHQPQPPQTPQA